MKKVFIVLFIISVTCLALYAADWDGDDYASKGKIITNADVEKTTAGGTGNTQVTKLASNVWNTVAFYTYFNDIDDSAKVYYQGSPDETYWFNLDSNGATQYTASDSANAVAATNYYAIFEHAQIARFFRIQVVADSTIDMSSWIVIGSN